MVRGLPWMIAADQDAAGDREQREEQDDEGHVFEEEGMERGCQRGRGPEARGRGLPSVSEGPTERDLAVMVVPERSARAGGPSAIESKQADERECPRRAPSDCAVDRLRRLGRAPRRWPAPARTARHENRRTADFLPRLPIADRPEAEQNPWKCGRRKTFLTPSLQEARRSGQSRPDSGTAGVPSTHWKAFGGSMLRPR